jgi:hypothetical protein
LPPVTAARSFADRVNRGFTEHVPEKLWDFSDENMFQTSMHAGVIFHPIFGMGGAAEFSGLREGE